MSEFEEKKAKTLLHPIFEKFRKEYAVPNSLIVDDYERDIISTANQLLANAEAEITKLKEERPSSQFLYSLSHNYQETTIELRKLEERFQRVRQFEQWLEDKHKEAEANIRSGTWRTEDPTYSKLCGESFAFEEAKEKLGVLMHASDKGEKEPMIKKV
jgi:hypothetical protein